MSQANNIVRRDDNASKNWVLVLTSLASLMAALDAMVVATALNAIRADLDASIGALEWTMNGYSLSFAVLLLPAAALGDRFGRRRMFVTGLAVFVAASAACAMAQSAAWLITARIVQGAGGALIMPLAMALLSAAFPLEERGKALGIFSSITGLALIVGPVLGGAIAEGVAWQWIFGSMFRSVSPSSRWRAGASQRASARLRRSTSQVSCWSPERRLLWSGP
jgi:MFS family permease